MSPLIMNITSSLGSLWNSLRNSRPRATNAMLSGACHRTVLGRPDPRIVFMTSPRLTDFISSTGHSSLNDRLEHQVPGELVVVPAERRLQQRDRDELFLRIHPEVGRERARPVVVAGGPRSRRQPVVLAYGDAEAPRVADAGGVVRP